MSAGSTLKIEMRNNVKVYEWMKGKVKVVLFMDDCL